jgi:hypothetical protein
MNDEQQKTQPAGYDAEGRPLYYQPPAPEEPQQAQSVVTTKPEGYKGHNFNPQLRAQYANEPDFVHATRSFEPVVPAASEELQRKHELSVQRFPYLNLSEGEFVILQIHRHPIGLFIPVAVTAFVVSILIAFAFLVPDFYGNLQPQTSLSSLLPAEEIIVSILLFLGFISIVFGAIAVWIYQKNQFFLTNESVIQEIQHGLFSRHEQTVSLGSIEDASFKRRGILQYIFNYGTMRLSTEGEETTYRFAFVEDPKAQIATVNNAIESFKNGRPVND